jgi:hypothetical protein
VAAHKVQLVALVWLAELVGVVLVALEHHMLAVAAVDF